jgi:hypothetical protein
MHRRQLLVSICGFILAAAGVAAQNSNNIKVVTVVKVFIAKDLPAYSVTYNYDFPQQSAVFVKGLGTVPPKGKLSYLSRDNQLEIRDPTGGLLVRTDLAPTIVAAAAPPLNMIPSEREFPDEFQAFPWDSRKSLLVSSNAVLNRYFRYLPREDKGRTFLVTTFTPLQLQNASAGIRGRMALLLSFPYDPAAGGYTFHVQSLVKEGRDLSDALRPPTDKSIVPAADTFVRNLIGQLTGEGDSHR